MSIGKNSLCFTLLALMPIPTFGQAAIPSYKKPIYLIFGATSAAVTSLLAYAVYEAWTRPTDSQILNNIILTIDKDLRRFLELVLILEQQAEYTQIYDKNSKLYKKYNKFLDNYRSSLLSRSTPRARYFTQQLDRIKSIKAENKTDIKLAITTIVDIIHKFIQEYVDKETDIGARLTYFLFGKKATYPKPASDEAITKIIRELTTAVNAFYADAYNLHNSIERSIKGGYKSPFTATELLDKLYKLNLNNFFSRVNQTRINQEQKLTQKLRTAGMPTEGIKVSLTNEIVKELLPTAYKKYGPGEPESETKTVIKPSKMEE